MKLWATAGDCTVDAQPDRAPPGMVWILVVAHDHEAHARAYATRSAAIRDLQSELAVLEEGGPPMADMPLEDRISEAANEVADFGGMSLRLVPFGD